MRSWSVCQDRKTSPRTLLHILTYHIIPKQQLAKCRRHSRQPEGIRMCACWSLRSRAHVQHSDAAKQTTLKSPFYISLTRQQVGTNGPFGPARGAPDQNKYARVV